jgi:hypothetical protein
MKFKARFEAKQEKHCQGEAGDEVKLRWSLLAASAALFVAGCGLRNQYQRVSWEATLDRLPDPACVRAAVASIPGVSRVETRNGLAGQSLQVFLKDGSVVGPDIYVTLLDKGLQFRMNYGDAPNVTLQRENAAQAIIASLTAACGMPELAPRVKENHLSDWEPYFFNI